MFGWHVLVIGRVVLFSLLQLRLLNFLTPEFAAVGCETTTFAVVTSTKFKFANN